VLQCGGKFRCQEAEVISSPARPAAAAASCQRISCVYGWGRGRYGRTEGKNEGLMDGRTGGLVDNGMDVWRGLLGGKSDL